METLISPQAHHESRVRFKIWIDREIHGGLTAYSAALARFVLLNLHNFILDRYYMTKTPESENLKLLVGHKSSFRPLQCSNLGEYMRLRVNHDDTQDFLAM